MGMRLFGAGPPTFWPLDLIEASAMTPAVMRSRGHQRDVGLNFPESKSESYQDFRLMA